MDYVRGLYVCTAWAARQAAGTAVLVGNGQWRSKGKKGPAVGRRVPPTMPRRPPATARRDEAGRGPPAVALPLVGRPARPVGVVRVSRAALPVRENTGFVGQNGTVA